MGIIRNWRRARLKRRPLPDSWRSILEDRLPFYRHVPDGRLASFHDNLKIFAWEKHFIGAGGLAITDEIQVVISASAVRLILYMDIGFYNRLTEIVVYPGAYQSSSKDEVRLGEAHQWGTVVLSWQAVLDGIRLPCDGHDTALHEFAHVLDRASGSFNGTPHLRASEHYRPWAQVMSRRFARLQSGQRSERKVLRTYGGKDEAEFFAVATESFFERPVLMKRTLPDLYAQLRRFYGFDPLSDPTCGLDEPGRTR